MESFNQWALEILEDPNLTNEYQESDCRCSKCEQGFDYVKNQSATYCRACIASVYATHDTFNGIRLGDRVVIGIGSWTHNGEVRKTEGRLKFIDSLGKFQIWDGEEMFGYDDFEFIEVL